MLIRKRKNLVLRLYNDPIAFLEYSNIMNDVCEKIDECNPYIKLKVFIVFDDIIADVLSNKKLQLFIRSPRMNISIVFITQSYFSAPKSIRLNSALYFIMKNLNKQDKLEANYLSDIDLKTL